MQTKRRTITSVGIDIGTTTSHLVFSRLVLEKDSFSRSKKFKISEREIFYRGDIHLTPLKEGNSEIDTEKLFPILKAEYDKAGLDFNEVDTGAVIITGESSKKRNADKIVEYLSSESGKFVAATAGPNFESVISAHGAGAVEFSKNHKCKLIHCDTGGGTSNITVINDGVITATACVNIGGRLIAYDSEKNIIRLEPAGHTILKTLGNSKNIGDKISQDELETVSKIMAQTLIDILGGEKETPLSEALYMTEHLPVDSFENEPKYSFSGGVSEFIYNKLNHEYGDIGPQLGKNIRELSDINLMNLIELPERIRATVIGASGFTLQVSGSTTYISPNFQLPVKNIPVVTPTINRDNLTVDNIHHEIRSALKRLDLEEGLTPIALAFQKPVPASYEKLKTFSLGLVKSMKNTVEANIPLILVFDTDIGNSVGNVLLRETGVSNILSIDEIPLSEGDFIDIGIPLSGSIIYPVVIKSLVFG